MLSGLKMDNSQKERLERELRFLKESLEAEVITKEEFLKGKERIERKLGSPSSENKEGGISIREIRQEKPVRPKEEPKTEHKQPEEATEKKEPEQKTEQYASKKKKKPKISYIVLLILGIVIIAAIYINSADSPEEPDIKDEIACFSDKDCTKEGMIARCIDPGTSGSRCSFIEDAEVKLAILNEESCESCDTSRMLSVIRQLFPNLEYESVDFEPDMALIENLSVKALPAYIFEENVKKAHNFNKTRRIFEKKGSRYVIMPGASGARYFFKRGEIENRLDLFVLAGKNASKKAEENVEELTELFGEKIDFRVKEIEENSDIAEELSLTSYPVFLINNRFKLPGVHSAETIKQEFCRWNDLEECGVELALNIK